MATLEASVCRLHPLMQTEGAGSPADKSSSKVDVGDLVEDEGGQDEDGLEGSPQQEVEGESLHDSVLGLEAGVDVESEESSNEGEEHGDDQREDVVSSSSQL